MYIRQVLRIPVHRLTIDAITCKGNLGHDIVNLSYVVTSVISSTLFLKCGMAIQLTPPFSVQYWWVNIIFH